MHHTAEALAKRGLNCYQQGQFETAIYYYQEALIQRPIWPEIYMKQGLVLDNLNQIKGAIYSYQKAIEQDSNYIQAYYHLGIAYQKEGQTDLAINTYKQAIEVSKKLNLPPEAQSHYLIDIYNHLGYLLISVQKIQEAISVFESGINQFKQEATLHNNLGQAFLEFKQDSKAVICFKNAVELEPKNAVFFQNLGKTFQALNLHQDAIESFKRAIQLQPESIFYHSALAESLISIGQFKSAIASLKVAIFSQNKFIDYYCSRAQSLTGKDELEKAIIACANFLNSLQVDSDFSRILDYLNQTYIHLGNTLVESKQYQKAEPYYHKSLQINPRSDEAYFQLNLCLEQQGKWNATQVIKQVLEEINPTLDYESYKINTANKQYNDHHNHQSLKLPFSNSKSEKCEGLNCQNCLKKVFAKFHIKPLGENIFSCEFVDQSLISEPQVNLSKFQYGRVWVTPQKNNWLVCDQIAIWNAEHQFIPKLSRSYPGQLPFCEKEHSFQNPNFDPNHFQPEEQSKLELIEGNVVVLSGLSGNVYFHWMVDILPRLEILRKRGYAWNQIDWFVVNSIQQPFQRETLEKLGIPLTKIIESDRCPYLEAEKLIVPSFPSDLGWLSSEALAFHRSLFLTSKTPHPPNLPTRIYISREQASYRRIINETEVVSWLSQWGFVRVELESMSVQQQANLFANAEMIVSAHGSGLTNIMFCCPGTTVIELVSPHYIRHYYWVISQQLKLQHFYIKGEEFGCYPVRQLMYPNPLTEDILISLKSLEKVMKVADIIKNPTMLSFKPPISNPVMYLNKNKITPNSTLQPAKPAVKTSTASTQSGLFLNSEDTDIYLHGAEALYTQKQYEQAAVACQRIISIKPHAKAYKILGNVRQNQGQVEEAKDCYAKAIQLQPNFAEVFCNLGTLYAQEQEWQPAIVCYQKAITLQPRLAIAYRNLARTWTQLGKKEEAAECWFHAYTLNPETVSAEEYLHLGNTLLEIGLVERAISSYCQAIQSNPYSQESYKYLGKAMKRQMQLSQEALEYQSIVALNAVGSLPGYKSGYEMQNEEINSLSSQQDKRSLKGLRGFFNNLFSPFNSEPEVSSAILEATLPTRGKNNHTVFQVSSLQEVNHQSEHQELSTNQSHHIDHQILSNSQLQLNQSFLESQPQQNLPSLSQKSQVEYYIRQAETEAQLGNLLTAIEACQQALKIQPDTAIAYKILGQIEQAQGHRKPAQNLYEKAINLGWKDAEVYLNLGTLCAQQQQWKDAVKYYQNSLKINPKSLVVYHNLSKVWKQLNKPLESAGCLYEAYSLEPQRVTAKDHFNLGNTLLKQNQITSAISCYKRVIEMDSTLTAAYQNLSEALKRQGKLDEAEFYLQQLEQLHYPTISIQKDHKPQNNNHNLFNKRNGYQSSELSEIAFVSPIHLNGHSNGKRELGSKVDTIEFSEQSEKVEVFATEKYSETLQTADYYLKEAEDFLKQKQFQKAIVSCQKLIEVQPDFAMTYKLWGNALQGLGRVEEAKEQYNQALTLDPSFAEVHTNLGSLYAKDQQWDSAISCYQKAISLKPNLASAYRNLAKVWKQLGKAEEWANCWYQALTLEPENVPIEEQVKFAQALITLGKLDWAISCYKQVIQVDPSQLEPYRNLGEIFIAKQQWEDAITIYHQAIEYYPQKSEFYCKLGQVLAQLERWEDAIAAYNQALEIDPNLATAYHNLAEIWVAQAQFDQAIRCYQQLIELEPKNWEAYHKLGDILQEKGLLDEAVEAYRQAIELTETESSSIENIEVETKN